MAELPFLVGPIAACYGDDDPGERLLVFDAGRGELWRVSLTSETVQVIMKNNRVEVRPYPADRRRKLMQERSGQIAKVIELFGLPEDFAA